MENNQSPLPFKKGEIRSEEEGFDGLPNCTRCGEPVEKLGYLDYGVIRVVYHKGPKCVIGVMKAE